MGDVMVCALALSMVYRRIVPSLGQTQEYEIGI